MQPQMVKCFWVFPKFHRLGPNKKVAYYLAPNGEIREGLKNISPFGVKSKCQFLCDPKR